MNDNILNQDSSAMAFGRYLKSMRTQMEIPIEAVADEIRISIRQLRHIEAEDHQELPDPVYVKGILRAYARFIGVDDNDIVDRYEVNRSAYDKIQSPESGFFNYNRKIMTRLGLLAGLLIIIIVLSVYLIYGSQTNSDLNAEESHTEKNEDIAFEAVNELTAGSFTENPNEKLFLKIDAVEDTSLKIIIDDSDPMEYLLHPMDHMELEASAKISLVIGNAGGVNVFLNEKPVLIPGKSGEVVNIELPQSK